MIEESDRSAIHELLARYCHSIDAARGELCAGLFTEDAVLETPVGTANGIAEIQEWIDGRLALRQPDIQVRHSHLTILLAPLSAAEVRVRSTLL
ncbi:MAG: nuclear transport factor 2 family protein [bacterium]|nr:nuclear transport factor 2 family protein [bacterium]